MKENYEQAVEQFLQSMSKEYYENGAGLKDSLDIMPIYDKYVWLFSREAVEDLLKREDAEGKEMASFAADGYLDSSVSVLSEQITNSMTRATVEWQGEKIPYRQASVILANEPDPTKRHKLESLIHAKTEDQNINRMERLQRLHAKARSLGFDTYLEMYDKLKKIHVKMLLHQMEDILQRTEDIYQVELDHYLGELGVNKEDATPADFAFLFRAPEFDSLFPADKLVPALDKTLSGMGIHLDSQPNVHLDTEARPLKSPRAFCVPLKVPEEVYLVISPRGGQDDYHAILHESGHAEHFAHISPDLPIAFKRFGDGSISEGYAFLMDNLMKNNRWFSEIMETNHVDDYLRLARFYKLWIVRRYAAKLQYEVKLHTTDDTPNMKPVYAEIMSKALHVKISESNYLADIDDGLYTANYLRAWIFEVMLRKHLEDTYGALWFRNTEAGKFLINLWKEGQKYSADELARRFCYEKLDHEPLALELTR